MSRIFICYRRNDSAGHAGWLQQHLVARFGKSRVFMDIDNIPVGADFVAEVRKALSSAAVALVLIGRQWLSLEHRKRLHEKGDHVRQEIAQALSGKLRVVPVLVHGASMPAGQDLPPDIRALAKRNASVLRDNSFPEDVAKLIRYLEKLPELKDAGESKRPERGTQGKPSAGGRKPRGSESKGDKAKSRAGGPRKENEPGAGAARRRPPPAKQPASGTPRSDAPAKTTRRAAPSQSETAETKARSRPATPPASGGTPTGKKATTPGGARTAAKSGAGRKRGASTSAGGGSTPKAGGSTKPQPPSKTNPPRSKSRGTGARRG